MELNILLLFMIFAAGIAIEAKDLLSSVIAMASVGFALCLAFLILKAPDLAITQLVVELLCLVILIKATIKKDLPLVIEGRWVFNTVSTLIFIIVFLFFSYAAVKELPDFGNPVMALMKNYLLAEAANSSGAENIVSAVTLNFRAYDTLGEVAVLFTSIIGVLAVLRHRGRKEILEEEADGK
jgi:multicomponent Na+:H+ antiporter subunit B